jgi:hypothetical protein
VTALATVLSTSMSRTVRTGALPESSAAPLMKNAAMEMTRIAASEDGMTLVILGRKAMMPIATATSPSMR